MKMKNILITLFASVIFLTACQKEPSFEDPNSIPGGGTGGGSSRGLLIRNVEVSGTDSNVSVYSYNGANRLIGFEASGAGIDINYTIKRNTAGIIIQTVIKSPQLVAQGIDSLATNIYYNGSASRYTHSIYSLTLSGFTISDSTVFTYDASGNISTAIAYTQIPIIGYKPTSKQEYLYGGGNLTSQKLYDYDDLTQTWVLDETLTVTYDAKVNPLQLGVEAIIIGSPTLFGPNNSLTQNYTDATDPANNNSRSNSFTYNIANKPSGGTSVVNPGAANSTLRFYYN